MSKDHHAKPFDPGTRTKLALFEAYLKEWLPVFVSQRWVQEINVFDFFAGPGQDLTGVKGSPLIILDVVEEYREMFQGKNLVVNLRFNEYDPGKKSEFDRVLSGRKPLNKKIAVATDHIYF